MSDPEATSDLSRLLSSIHWSLETHVAPNVQGGLAQSYVRTLLAMLKHAERKARFEGPVLREDLQDLTGVAAKLGVGNEMAQADCSALDSGALEARIADLDAALSKSLPSLDAAQREIFDAFVLRRIDRRRRYMPDSSPANSF